jgi:hypothetical protein
VEIPVGAANALIVLLPEEKGAGRWRAIVLEDGETRFRPGQLGIFDLSGLELEGTLNERPLKLGPCRRDITLALFARHQPAFAMHGMPGEIARNRQEHGRHQHPFQDALEDGKQRHWRVNPAT